MDYYNIKSLCDYHYYSTKPTNGVAKIEFVTGDIYFKS